MIILFYILAAMFVASLVVTFMYRWKGLTEQERSSGMSRLLFLLELFFLTIIYAFLFVFAYIGLGIATGQL